MKTRTNLHAGATVCPEANLWRKRANAMAETLGKCKKIDKNLPDYPIYISPTGPVILPIGGGGDYPAGYVAGSTGGSYDGRDYSGYCG